MAITVIIVTYNSDACIARALQCVIEHPAVTECWIVDNASEDGTLALVAHQFPAVKIIRNQQNKGFGAACNQALVKVMSEFALLMNPDATINTEGIDRLLACAANYPKAALIAPKLAGNAFDPSTHAFRAPIPNVAPFPSTMVAPNVHGVSFISGALAVWRMDLMRHVGFFDPRFFLFYEDDDLSIRVHRRGYQMLICSDVTASHPPGNSCAPSTYIDALKLQSSTWSSLYIQRKYHGWVAAYLAAYTIIRTASAQLRIATEITMADPNTLRQASQLHANRRGAALQFMKNPWRFRFRHDQ